MEKQTIIELIGYLGSFLVLVSFLMTSVFKLRVINTVGSIIFTIYAIIIKSYPTAVMNFCLVLINIRFLWKMRHTGHQYELVKIDPDDAYLQYILARQQKDIENCFPHLAMNPNINESEVNRAYMVTCNGNPAGITIGKEEGGTFNLRLDYSFTEYRDFSIGEFLMRKLKEEGIERLIYDGPTEHHMPYLNKMGFQEIGGHYERGL